VSCKRTPRQECTWQKNRLRGYPHQWREIVTNPGVLNHLGRTRQGQLIVGVRSRDSELDLQYPHPAVVSEGLQRVGFQGRDSGCREPVVDQVIAIPHALVTGEAEEVIDDTPAGCGDVDLVGCHPNMVAEQARKCRMQRDFLLSPSAISPKRFSVTG
jgi:hypothetical protein